MTSSSTYLSIWGCKVVLRLVKEVLVVFDDVFTVELVEDAVKGTPITVVSDATSVVTLSSKVADSIILYIL